MGYEKIRKPVLAHELLDDHPIVGGAYMQNNVTATLNSGEAVGTSLQAAGTATLKGLSRFFTLSGTEMTYDGLSRPRVFKVTIMCSVIATNNQDVKLTIGKNGVPLDETHMEVITTGGVSRREPLSTQGILRLEPGDTVAPFLANETSATDITMHDLTLVVEALN